MRANTHTHTYTHTHTHTRTHSCMRLKMSVWRWSRRRPCLFVCLFSTQSWCVVAFTCDFRWTDGDDSCDGTWIQQLVCVCVCVCVRADVGSINSQQLCLHEVCWSANKQSKNKTLHVNTESVWKIQTKLFFLFVRQTFVIFCFTPGVFTQKPQRLSNETCFWCSCLPQDELTELRGFDSSSSATCRSTFDQQHSMLAC